MECGNCTICCKILDIPWMDSPAGEYCKECDEGIGCKIYNTAPKDCLDFQCAYNQMKQVSINLRQDRCGVIFEKVTDNIFLGTVNLNETQLKDVVKNQIDSLLKEGFSIVLLNSKIKEPFIYVSENNTANEVWKTFQQEVIKRNGSS